MRWVETSLKKAWHLQNRSFLKINYCLASPLKPKVLQQRQWWPICVLNKLFHLDFWRDHIIDVIVHLERSHSVLKSTFCPTNQKVWDDHMFRETLWKRSVKLMHATSDFFMIISLWCFQVQLIRITYFLLLISRARMCINHFQEQGKNQCSNRSICVYIMYFNL